jgi:hypothetical protein
MYICTQNSASDAHVELGCASILDLMLAAAALHQAAAQPGQTMAQLTPWWAR